MADRIGGPIRILFSVLALLVLDAPGTLSQWSTPRLIDKVKVGASDENLALAVAVSPRRELAIVVSEMDTLYCYYSADNGRSFSRSVVAQGWYNYLSGAYIERVDAAGFDSHSNLFILWLMIQWDDAVGWASFRLSKSSDGGKTFSLFWVTPLIVGSSLIRGALVIDSADRVHCVWDSYDKYRYTRFSAHDSSDTVESILPVPVLHSLPRPSCSLFPNGQALHVALNTPGPGYSAGLYYVESTDGGTTYSPMIPVDTPNAHYPFFHEMPGVGLSLIHTSVPQFHYFDDTALVVQRKLDSSFSTPVLLLGNLGASSDQPIVVRSRGASIYLTYSRDGVAYYELIDTGSAPYDSLFLSGHSEPDLAIDSLGGKYLVSVYQDNPYLTTKDVVLDVRIEHSAHPTSFNLRQNYPNPFNPQTQIPYEISERGPVELLVCDVLGREVARLVNEVRAPGRYQVSWDSSRAASGVYFYTLRVHGLTQTRRMILLK